MKKIRNLKKEEWTKIISLSLAVLTVLGLVAGIIFNIAYSPNEEKEGKKEREEGVILIEPSEKGDVYAILLNSSELVFLKSEKEIRVGDVYELSDWGEREITEVYSGFENVVFESTTDVPWRHVREEIYEVYVDSNIAPISTAYWFYGFKECFVMNLEKLDVSNVTTMESMFAFCNNLFDFEFHNWDTSNVTNMSNMFQSCYELYHLNIMEWNTSKVTDMSEMFRDCISLEFFDAYMWDVSKVTNMSHMFDGCKELSHLDAFDWDTSSVTDVSAMFRKCENLDFDAFLWDMSSVTSFDKFNDGAPGVNNPFVEEE